MSYDKAKLNRLYKVVIQSNTMISDYDFLFETNDPFIKECRKDFGLPKTSQVFTPSTLNAFTSIWMEDENTLFTYIKIYLKIHCEKFHMNRTYVVFDGRIKGKGKKNHTHEIVTDDFSDVYVAILTHVPGLKKWLYEAVQEDIEELEELFEERSSRTDSFGTIDLMDTLDRGLMMKEMFYFRHLLNN